MLERLGCQVDVVANGREAVRMLGMLPYDLAFVDCQMPEMDGYQATAEIRRLPGRASRTPLIALTANAQPQDRQRCLSAGMDGYIAKPVQVSALREALARYAGASPAAGTDREAPFDREHLLLLLGSDPEMLGSIVSLSQEELPRLLSRVVSAQSQADPAELARAAHELKGALLSLDAHPAAEMARRVEMLGRQQRSSEAEPALQALQQETDRLLQGLQALVGKGAAVTAARSRSTELVRV
jgi:CheY-like chemotaxis protein/HPt (histidine-containing phosphotransfer) domain-containing protein